MVGSEDRISYSLLDRSHTIGVKHLKFNVKRDQALLWMFQDREHRSARVFLYTQQTWLLKFQAVLEASGVVGLKVTLPFSA